METAVVRQFLDFFQDFISLCQSNSWLNNETSAEEFQNAFLISGHIENCLVKVNKKFLLTEFLDIVNKDQSASSITLSQCLTDPPKYILKKIIQSNINISKVDVAFKVFLDVFSEKKLQECLSDIMLEKGSKETLLNNLQVEIPKEKILAFKSQLFMTELGSSDNMEKFIMEMLHNCTQDTMDMLTKCLLCKDPVYTNVVNSCVNVFIQTMLCKDVSKKTFWKFFFHIEEDDFVQICLCHSDLFQTITKALIDCAKLIKENMCANFFYIDLTYSELALVVQKINKNDNLKLEFLDILYTSNTDLEFWNNIIES